MSSPTVIINNFEANENDVLSVLESNYDLELEKVSIKETENDSVRYYNILNTLGLNININYPLNVLIEAIFQIHIISESTYMRSRNWEFKNNKLSNIIKMNLYPEIYKNRKYTSYLEVKRILKIIIRNYKYSMVLDNLNTENKMNNNIIMPKQEIIGFNFNNPRWAPLYDFNI